MTDSANGAASTLFCRITAVVFVVGLAALAIQLKRVQVDAAPEFNFEKNRQSIRRVRTAGVRGRILDSTGCTLAGNRRTFSIVCNPARFQRRTWSATVEAIADGMRHVGEVIGVGAVLSERDIRRHIDISLSMPLVAWSDVSEVTLARFCEHGRSFPGFDVMDTVERTYPYGTVAAHVVGYVGRDAGVAEKGDARFRFSEWELAGRSGLEYYYDGYLRGVAGERDQLVDARGFAIREWTVTEGGEGPDLKLTIDIDVQYAVERELAGLCGAGVVLDPRDGSVLALASAPGFNLNDMVPVLRGDLYRRLIDDPSKPLLNRATGGTYAPGSTFKPITALAGLSVGYPEDAEYGCCGAFDIGGMSIRCSSRWGHGVMHVREALRDSCNPFFCNLGCECGTNVLCKMAREFGLGSKTGIDYPDDRAGVVPTGEWKQDNFGERWYPGDLAQMSIGQGMLLVSPLQMAVVAGALGTGMVAKPRLNVDAPVSLRRLAVSGRDLAVVRDGMRMVTSTEGHRGTGWRGAYGVRANVIGKTGTAEVGVGVRRRKNTWFIAYAEGLDGKRAVAVALVVENGVSGGGTAAPKVAAVLKRIFGEVRS